MADLHQESLVFLCFELLYVFLDLKCDALGRWLVLG
jgi:hypothetical protein